MAHYVAGEMSRASLLKVELGGEMGAFKNALLEVRGVAAGPFGIGLPGNLPAGTVILDATGTASENAIDSRILTLAMVREFREGLYRNDVWASRGIDNIFMPRWGSPDIAWALRPTTYAQVSDRVRELFSSKIAEKKGSALLIHAGATRYLFAKADTLRYDGPMVASEPAPGSQVYMTFDNDTSAWDLLTPMTSPLDDSLEERLRSHHGSGTSR
jgi:hypothetical protein